MPLLLILVGFLWQCSHLEEKPTPTTILLSLDGFRHDYLELYHPPHLSQLKQQGAYADALIPTFPTKTFPNHLSIVTGVHPGEHGIIANKFYNETKSSLYTLSDRKQVEDGRWYLVEPIWVKARRAGLLSATYFWPGSEAPIGGLTPHEFKKYDDSIPNIKRVEQVLQWLSRPLAKRPKFIALYFSDVDSQGHKFGPEAKETKEAVLHIDQMVGALWQGIKDQGLESEVNLIITSDHGMTALSEDKIIPLPEWLLREDSPMDDYLNGGAFLQIWPKPGRHQELFNQIKPQHFQAFEKGRFPKRWHLNENPRIAPILLVADLGYQFLAGQGSSSSPARLAKGGHGYDNEQKDMHGVFIAIGRDIKPAHLKAFSNTEVYTLLTNLLNLPSPRFSDQEALKALR